MKVCDATQPSQPASRDTSDSEGCAAVVLVIVVCNSDTGKSLDYLAVESLVFMNIYLYVCMCVLAGLAWLILLRGRAIVSSAKVLLQGVPTVPTA